MDTVLQCFLEYLSYLQGTYIEWPYSWPCLQITLSHQPTAYRSTTSNLQQTNTEKLGTRPLPHAIPVYNIDGTPNELGSIKEEVNLTCTYGGYTERATFLVTSLGSLSIILGHTWLVKHNPDVNWRTGQVKMT